MPFKTPATTGRGLMAPRTDYATPIPSGVASPVTTNHGSSCCQLQKYRQLKYWPRNAALGDVRGAGRKGLLGPRAPLHRPRGDQLGGQPHPPSPSVPSICLLDFSGCVFFSILGGFNCEIDYKSTPIDPELLCIAPQETNSEIDPQPSTLNPNLRTLNTEHNTKH